MLKIVEELEQSKTRLSQLLEHLDFTALESQLKELQTKSEDDHLWDDPSYAQSIMKQYSDLKFEVESWRNLKSRIDGLLDLAELEDESLIDELTAESQAITKELDQKELSVLLSGKYDKGNALLSLNAGAGGTDSQDWAGMLQRMYLRWAERSGFKSEIIDLTEGEEAGIKGVTILIEGRYAYGSLRSEKGVPRLVRLSPFDSNHRRHTSFAQAEVLPEIENDNEIVIPPEDVRIDIYKSSGAGGQNVQKNATAIRLTHIPTGLIVTCQNERSQIQNRENAFKVLRGRLAQIKQEEQERQLAEIKGEHQKNEWGSQIRSYVLHPYQMVKDHRTEYEDGNTQAILDGDLDGFMEAYLRWKRD
ncbi:MAG TPA: peptide chain release factor 2 [Bellilinea sp.]|nr:peptide chain release factor 2 [Bellilinea sp.]